ncbi:MULTISPECIES: hypothetical protein [Giesbergeria]|uniref:DUF1640 domain-containing protein n=1 Tax=Giesbergeria sinuosa TaxID=80883 RepID=A0ABV9QBR5_9BURK
MPPDTTHEVGLLHKVAARIETLHGDVSDIKGVVKELTAAVTKLALIEERQAQASQALERAFKEIDKCCTKTDTVESRVDALEREQPMQHQVSQWVIAAVYGAAGLAVMFAAKQIGLL